jgi:dihydroceramidase
MPVPYWGPVTSSVDFCEANYAFTQYVAEPANAASSLVFVALGLLGVHKVQHLRGEPAGAGAAMVSPWVARGFLACYVSLAVVGLGSVALHTTLRAQEQALDEIPMLLLSFSIIALLCELDCAGPRLKRPWLPLATAAAAATAVAVYSCFQHLYAVFLAMYIATVVVIVVWTGALALRRRPAAAAERVRVALIRPLWGGAIIAYVVGGSVAWVTDFVFCARFATLGAAVSMVLHPLWHLGAGVGTYLAVQVLAAARAEALRTRPALRWLAGVLPYVHHG